MHLLTILPIFGNNYTNMSESFWIITLHVNFQVGSKCQTLSEACDTKHNLHLSECSVAHTCKYTLHFHKEASNTFITCDGLWILTYKDWTKIQELHLADSMYRKSLKVRSETKSGANAACCQSERKGGFRVRFKSLLIRISPPNLASIGEGRVLSPFSSQCHDGGYVNLTDFIVFFGYFSCSLVSH